MSRRSILSMSRPRRWLIAGLALAALGVGVATQAGLRASVASKAAAEASFELSGGSFAGQPARVAVSKDRDGVARERLSFGLPLEAKADFTVVLHRGEPIQHAPRARTELSRLGPIADLPVTLVGAPRTIDARLGPVEVVDLTLGTGAGRKSCLGFVAPLPNARRSALSGWYCAALGEAARDEVLTRLLDRLRPRANADLAASGGHPLS